MWLATALANQVVVSQVGEDVNNEMQSQFTAEREAELRKALALAQSALIGWEDS